jgi:hypothetical protein
VKWLCEGHGSTFKSKHCQIYNLHQLGTLQDARLPSWYINCDDLLVICHQLNNWWRLWCRLLFTKLMWCLTQRYLRLSQHPGDCLGCYGIELEMEYHVKGPDVCQITAHRPPPGLLCGKFCSITQEGGDCWIQKCR